MNSTDEELFEEARLELASRKDEPYGLGRDWMLIDRLFQALDDCRLGEDQRLAGVPPPTC